MDEKADRWEGRTAPELAGRWGVAAVHLFASVGSTNDVARRLAAGGAEPGTLVIAERQTAGRGRAGRAWASPPGVGLWLSMIGAPGHRVSDTLPLRVGVAAARALDGFTSGAPVGIKWPNDLLLGDRKLGGVLCEGAWEGDVQRFVILGVGLNLLQSSADFPAELRDSAISLAMATRTMPDRLDVADRLVEELVRVATRGAGLDAAAAAELDRRDILRGREVSVTDPVTGGAIVSGTALGISPDGLLLVRSDAGAVRTIGSGSVRPRVESAAARACTDEPLP